MFHGMGEGDDPVQERRTHGHAMQRQGSGRTLFQLAKKDARRRLYSALLGTGAGTGLPSA